MCIYCFNWPFKKDGRIGKSLHENCIQALHKADVNIMVIRWLKFMIFKLEIVLKIAVNRYH